MALSYAQVAAENAPPSSEQPRPDPSLWSTSPPSAPSVVDDTAKVNLVHPSFKDSPVTTNSQTPPDNDPFEGYPQVHNVPKKSTQSKRRREVQAEGAYLWQVTKRYLFRPGVAGGLVGIVNMGLLASAAQAFYTEPHLRHDRKAISSTLAATLALLTLEGYVADKYHQTARGQEEARKAREEGTFIYKFLREAILRPGVLGGLIGLVNTAVLGAVGYMSYVYWDRPRWDRRALSAVTVGLLSLFGGEGLLAERLRKRRG